ncbi:MAG TPA: hypothetical protein VKV26_05390 [Dehalococcoidia bacterium]|nr:hypothetical protein [Dehalococcoidia bacterium]
MTMAAGIVEYSISPEHAETLRDRVQTYLLPAARAAQGYRGFLVVDCGAGKRIGIVLFDSAANAQTAQGTLGPLGMKHTGALMQGAIERSVGTVVINDGLFADAVVR